MSINVELRVSGVEEISQAVGKLDRAVQLQVQAKLGEWGKRVRMEATRLAPSRTGYLRSTIYERVQQWQVDIGASARYAAAVEFGALRAQARPFLQPALDIHLPALEGVLAEALDAAKLEAGL